MRARRGRAWKRSCWRRSRRVPREDVRPLEHERARARRRAGRPPRAARAGAPARRSRRPATPPPGVIHQTSPVTGCCQAHQEHAALAVDDERAHRRARRPARASRAARETSAAARRTGTAAFAGEVDGQDEERRVVPSVAQLRPELGRARRRRRGRPPCRRRRSRAAGARARRCSSRAGVEVAAAEVARARRRPVGGVRDAEAELEQLELLRRVEQAAA